MGVAEGKMFEESVAGAVVRGYEQGELGVALQLQLQLGWRLGNEAAQGLWL